MTVNSHYNKCVSSVGIKRIVCSCLAFYLVCCLCTLGPFLLAFSLDSRLCSVEVALLEYVLYYHNRPNYRAYSYKRTVKQFRSLQMTKSVLFVYFS